MNQANFFASFTYKWRQRELLPFGIFIIGKTMRDKKKNETGYFVCGTSQNETG